MAWAEGSFFSAATDANDRQGIDRNAAPPLSGRRERVDGGTLWSISHDFTSSAISSAALGDSTNLRRTRTASTGLRYWGRSL